MIRNGFTLVETTIVLVIIALIAGGILVGRDMIHQAELRAVGTEANKYRTAALAFKEKYRYAPGDLPNATSYWGKDTSVCAAAAGTASSTGTCNGNGDGHVYWCSNISGGDFSCKEPFWFWQQLALAGLIEGTYTGKGTATVTYYTAGTNTPLSKYPGIVWVMAYNNIYNYGDIYYFSVDYGNYLFTSLPGSLDQGGAGTFSGMDAYSIDAKLDDGKPATGRIIGGGIPSDYSCAYCGNASKTNICTTSTNSTDFSGSYRTSNTDKVCYLNFTKLI